MTRVHFISSFISSYPWHRENAYEHLMNAQDRKYLGAVRAFNPYDLYTKAADRPDVEKLRPFYEELWNEFFPPQLAF